MEGFFPQSIDLLGVAVRDTVLSTWIMMALVAAAAVAARLAFPRGVELLVETLNDTLSDLMERPAGPFLPFLGALAVFVALANLLSVLPAIPLPGGQMLPIRSPTADLNTPVALAATVFFAVHVYGVRSQGVLGYLKDLASPIYLAPLTFTLEVFGQISRTVSLALRLFGNIISTDLVVAVIASLVAWIVPLPVIVLSMFTGLLQAYIFTSLAAVFIAGGLASYEEEGRQSEPLSSPGKE